jgi:DNA polymerase elongation subunit (family B)
LEFISKNPWSGAGVQKDYIDCSFRDTVLTAFGYSHAKKDDIDLVYPKKGPEEDELRGQICKILETNLVPFFSVENHSLTQEEFLRIGFANTHSKSGRKVADISSGAALGTTATSATANDDEEEEGDEWDVTEECGTNGPSVTRVEQSEDCGVGGANEVDTGFFGSRHSKKKFSAEEKLPDVVILSDLVLYTKLPTYEKVAILTTLLDSVLSPLEGDCVTFIGSCFMKYGDEDASNIYSHCIAVGDCAPVDNVQIECVQTEKELLLKWQELVIKEDPDVIVGYNIFGFDYEFLFRRAQENSIEKLFLQLSRRSDEYIKNDLENTKICLASGEFDLRYPKMSGRLQIDMYVYMRRDYNMSSYKLDDVASSFIGDAIKDVVYYENGNIVDAHVRNRTGTGAGAGARTGFVTRNVVGLSVGDYIRVEEGGFSTDYYAKGRKMQVEAIEAGGGGAVTILVGGKHTPDNSKRLRWGLAKDDLSPKDLFRMANEGASSKAIVAKYCVQDCRLVLNLLNKIDVLTGYIEMANICSVPMSFLVLRGQGIKLTSYMAKKCRESGLLMPDLEKSQGDEAYEGAIVLPPKCKMYLDDPVACVDFASLYPSSMISRNLSHDSKVWTQEFDLQGRPLTARIGHFTTEDDLRKRGLKYEIIEFDTYKYERRGTSSAKVKTGWMSCCFIQPGDTGKKAILPSILEELLRARKETKSRAKLEVDPFMKNILDKRQLGYKLTANSLYGQCGAKTSTFYDKDIAAATTKTGREMLIAARNFIEKEFKGPKMTSNHGLVHTDAKYVYGDSITSYCPLLLKIDGEEKDQLIVTSVEDACARFGRQRNGEVAWHQYLHTKEICTPDPRWNVCSWTEQGWTSVKFFIRHKLHERKSILRIATTRGVVDVTDDHSLLRPSGESVCAAHPDSDYKKASSAGGAVRVSAGDHLMAAPLKFRHCPEGENRSESEEITPAAAATARLDGFIVMCGQVNMCFQSTTLSLLHVNPPMLKRYWKYMSEVPEWKFLDIAISAFPVLHKHRLMCRIRHEQNGTSCPLPPFPKLIPDSYFAPSCLRETRIQFLKGVIDGNGTTGYAHKIKVENHTLAAQLFVLCKFLLGMNTTRILTKRKGKYSVVVCILDLEGGGPSDGDLQSQRMVKKARILSIEKIPYSGFVYDLTTINHHFAAGCGELIVHNTDSVFFSFNLQEMQGGPGNPGVDIRGQRALEITIDLAQEAADAFTRHLNADPIELAYEKTLMPFILLAKKRYVGMLYEMSPDIKEAKLKYMGLSLKRRDTSDYFKDTYGMVIKKLMSREGMESVLVQLQARMKELISGEVPLEKLIISKALRESYKNPQTIAHKVLADRIGARDPGNKPKPGDRVQFVYILQSNVRALLGERIETPEFIRQNKLRIDYSYYITNQLMRPILQLLGSSLLDIVKIVHPLFFKYHRQQEKALMDITKDCLASTDDKTAEGELGPKGIEMEAKKRERYCSAIIQELIFKDILSELKQRKEGNQAITTFFAPQKRPRIT